MASVSPRPTPTGGVSWRVQFRVDGKMRQASFDDKRGADQFGALVDKVGGAAALEVLAARRSNTTHAPTLNEWAARYLDAESGLLTGIEEGTREGYKRAAERSFLVILGDYPVDTIQKADVGKWLTWQAKQPAFRDRNKPPAEQKPVSAKTIKNYHSILSALLGAAVDEKIREDNPAYRTKLPRGVQHEATFLSPAEFNTLLHFIPQKHQRFVLFLAGTGCRWGEATALMWKDVNLNGPTPAVRVTQAWKKAEKGGPVLKHPKSKRSRRTVSLFPQLVEVMGTPGKPNDLVFPNETGGHMWHGAFTRTWTTALRKAQDRGLCLDEGLEPIASSPSIHDLRHTHASWLIASGVPLPYVQARLGHESITTTVNTYGHLVPDAHQQMSAVVADTLAGLRALTN